MRAEYDFSKGKRGRIARVSGGKDRITIRIDRDILTWFRKQVERSGGGSYQTLINQALRSFKDGSAPALERTLRRVIREEVRAKPAPSRSKTRKRA